MHKRTPFIITGFVLVVSLFALTAWADRTFQTSYWESQVLTKAIISIAWGDVDGDAQPELVALSQTDLTVYAVNGSSLQEKSHLVAPRTETFHRVSIGDWNADGQNEILLNGFLRQRVFSRFYQVAAGKMSAKLEYDQLVVPLQDANEVRLHSQVLSGHGQWGHDFHRLAWQNNGYVEDKSIPLNAGVNPTSPASLFNVTGMGDGQLIELTGDQKLRVFDHNGKRLWQSGVNYGGAFDVIDFKDRDALGLDRSTSMVIEPRMAFDALRRDLIVVRNEGFLKNVIGAVPNMKSGQLSLLHWSGSSFQESYNWPRLDGALTDVILADFNGDGTLEVLVSLLVRKSGYFDALDGLNSIIAVLPMPGSVYSVPVYQQQVISGPSVFVPSSVPAVSPVVPGTATPESPAQLEKAPAPFAPSSPGL